MWSNEQITVECPEGHPVTVYASEYDLHSPAECDDFGMHDECWDAGEVADLKQALADVENVYQQFHDALGHETFTFERCRQQPCRDFN